MKSNPHLLCALLLFGCTQARPPAATTQPSDPLVWQATFTNTPPTIDGQVDGVWGKARALRVTVREALGGGAPQEVTLRALYTEDRVFVLAKWADATRSDMRDPYVWDAKQKEYVRPTEPDDQFALDFPIEGDFKINMMTTAAYVADVWHWKAGRGNPAGWVDDKRHLIGDRGRSDAKVYDMGGRETAHIARPMDAGTPAYRRTPKPTAYTQDRIDSYEPAQPTGSLADVSGKGVHDGTTWTLEISRAFDTGHDDDAVIERKQDNVCAIAILNDELYWNHSVSGKIILRFAPR